VPLRSVHSTWPTASACLPAPGLRERVCVCEKERHRRRETEGFSSEATAQTPSQLDAR
jgi:hypothetical protein